MYISLTENITPSLIHLHGFQLLLLLPEFIEITFFVCTKRINLLILKKSSDRLVIVAKRFLKLPNLHMLIKQKSPLLPRNLALVTFGEFFNTILSKGKSAIPLLLNGPEVLSSASDKSKLFPEYFSKNSNLDDSCISLPVFSSRTHLKLHNISVTPIMVKKVIMNES